jgi:hypothetical protein
MLRISGLKGMSLLILFYRDMVNSYIKTLEAMMSFSSLLG